MGFGAIQHSGNAFGPRKRAVLRAPACRQRQAFGAAIAKQLAIAWPAQARGPAPHPVAFPPDLP
jgi:hypothetical protein